jgi:hypothetical protein
MVLMMPQQMKMLLFHHEGIRMQDTTVSDFTTLICIRTKELRKNNR